MGQLTEGYLSCSKKLKTLGICFLLQWAFYSHGLIRAESLHRLWGRGDCAEEGTAVNGMSLVLFFFPPTLISSYLATKGPALLFVHIAVFYSSEKLITENKEKGKKGQYERWRLERYSSGTVEQILSLQNNYSELVLLSVFEIHKPTSI